MKNFNLIKFLKEGKLYENKTLLKEHTPGYDTRKFGEALPTLESIKADYEAKKENLTYEPEDMDISTDDDTYDDLVIIGSGYLDIKNKFRERPSQTNSEYAEIGQKVVDQLHNGDKEAALDFIYSKINESKSEEEIDNETIMNKVKAIKPLFSGLNYPDSVIVNFVQTHFNDIVGFSDEEIMDEFKEFITINSEYVSEGMILEAKKSEIDKKLEEIDKEGRIVTLEAKIAAIDEAIEAKNNRINMVQEDENLSELVDKKRIKEMQNEIKLLEKQKVGFDKMLEKINNNGKKKKEIVGEYSTKTY